MRMGKNAGSLPKLDTVNKIVMKLADPITKGSLKLGDNLASTPKSMKHLPPAHPEIIT